jgi:hypothetical protein
MSVNPEFRRNLWLELSPYRLISMPVVLGAIFYLAYLTDDNRMAGRVSSALTSLFFLITMVWGTKLASESIMNEIRDHTWDGQRMSVITAWQLTWGKLFGSAIYPWYGALICMLCFGLSASEHDPGHTLKTMLVLLLSAVLAHAVSLLASLMAIRKECKFNKSQTAAMLILGIIVAGPFINLALGRGMAVTWFGESYSQMDFLLFSVLAYAFWAVMGVYHMLRLELQMKNGPWAWFGFVLFIMLHGAGFVHGPPQVGRHALSAASPGFLAAYGISLAAIYVMAFAERKDFLSLQALVRLVSGGNWRRFPERAPRWLLTLPIALAAGGAVIVSAGSGNSGMAEVIAFVVVTLLFMSRDMGIMLFCNLGATTRRADMLFVLYLVLLYGIFPATLSAMQLNGATLAFWPRVEAYPFLGCVIVLLEVCALAFVVVIRWKKRSAEGKGKGNYQRQ